MPALHSVSAMHAAISSAVLRWSELQAFACCNTKASKQERERERERETETETEGESMQVQPEKLLAAIDVHFAVWYGHSDQAYSLTVLVEGVIGPIGRLWRIPRFPDSPHSCCNASLPAPRIPARRVRHG